MSVLWKSGRLLRLTGWTSTYTTARKTKKTVLWTLKNSSCDVFNECLYQLCEHMCMFREQQWGQSAAVLPYCEGFAYLSSRSLRWTVYKVFQWVILLFVCEFVALIWRSSLCLYCMKHAVSVRKKNHWAKISQRRMEDLCNWVKLKILPLLCNERGKKQKENINKDISIRLYVVMYLCS